MFPWILAYVIFVHGFFSNSNVILTSMFNSLAAPLHDLFNASVRQHYGVTLDDKGMSLVISILPNFELLGNLLSVIVIVPQMDSFGRRFAAVYIRLFFTISSCTVFIVSNYAQSIEAYACGQFLLGFVHPTKMMVMKLYLSECVPRQYRAFIAIAVGSFVIFSNLFASFLSLPSILGTPISWRYIPLICAFIEVAYFLLAFRLPESPKWLMAKKKPVMHVISSISFYHGKSVDIPEVMREIQDEIDLTGKDKLSLIDILKDRTFRSVFSIIFAASLMSALSITIIGQFYTNTLLLQYGYVMETALKVSMINQMLFLPVIFAMPFLFERIGRRPLFLFSGLASILNVVAYFAAQTLFDLNGPNTLSMALGACAIFLSSLAVITGLTITYVVLIADLLPPSAKVVISQFVLAVNLLAQIPAVFLFPNLISTLGSYGFLPFLVIQIALLSYIFKTLPETKLRPVASNVHHMNVSETPRKQSGISCRQRSSLGSSLDSCDENQAMRPVMTNWKSYGSTNVTM
ncbi:hypothetical protein L596_024035 [Steinernema carpocapsae]|uniref:Major facilitator superfamily (MFS) profile domain-containing protein n=1 Tax=Steinernema carpocapsae TaxID=34508 RepID=A0A4U5MG78_STECR|nr:hypothetical protein L596_024035 [Steinernema carpocapsae]